MYCKKNVSLKKQRNQDAPFCSPYCKDLAVEVLPPAFTHSREVGFGRFGQTALTFG